MEELAAFLQIKRFPLAAVGVLRMTEDKMAHTKLLSVLAGFLDGAVKREIWPVNAPLRLQTKCFANQPICTADIGLRTGMNRIITKVEQRLTVWKLKPAAKLAHGRATGVEKGECSDCRRKTFSIGDWEKTDLTMEERLDLL